MLKRFFSLLAVGALLSVPAVSSAQILYDAPPDGTTGVVNQAFPDFPDFSSYLVSDVTISSDTTLGVVEMYCFEAGGVTINWEGNVTSGILNVFPKTGALPDNVTDDPGAGTVVPIDFTLVSETGGDGTGQYLMSACGVDVDMPAGDYWVGLTPDAEFGIYSQVFFFDSLVIQGEESAFRNPGGGFAVGTDWGPTSVVLSLGAPYEQAMQLREPENCGGGGTFCPSAVTLHRGLLTAGDLDSLCGVDENRYEGQPFFVLNDSEAPFWPWVTGNVGAGPGPSVSVSITSQAGTPGLTYTVETMNYTTNSLDVIGVQNESFNNDQTVVFAMTSDHVDANGDVETHVGWRKTGLTINFPWTARVNDISWTTQ